MIVGGLCSLQQFVQSMHVFGDGQGVGVVIGSDHREVSEAMAEAEMLIVMI